MIHYACDRCSVKIDSTTEVVSVGRKRFTGAVRNNHLCFECDAELDRWFRTSD